MPRSTITPTIPPSWTAWGTSVKALVVALSEVLRLYKNPQEPIRLADWDEKLNLVQEERTKCSKAVAAVGKAAQQVTVSRKLHRIHRDAEQWADWMLQQWELKLDDPNTIQRWHAKAMQPISRLWLAVNRNDFLEELEEAAILGGKPTKAPATTEEVFVPSPVQEAILEALEGKALRQSELEKATGYDRRQLHRKSGREELIDLDKVQHHSRLGYYRPDQPPPELR